MDEHAPAADAPQPSVKVTRRRKRDWGEDKRSVAKDVLRKVVKTSDVAQKVQMAHLRLRYQELQHPLTNYIRPMLQATSGRIHPKVLPTQKSGRWSTLNPPLTNFSKVCISPDCPKTWHEKRDTCWSVRDCIMPDAGTFWIDTDLDAIEARIFALKVHDVEGVTAFNTGMDIHTLTACRLFDLPLPHDVMNPHLSSEDAVWREKVQWRGKDDTRRGIAKNFRYGTQYCLKPEAVLTIKDLEQFNLSQAELLRLAHLYWQITQPQQIAKFEHMKRIRKAKVARTLYGSRRIFFDASDDTAKEGFNHEIQGTVVDYMNQVLLRIVREYPGSYIVHNGHDSYKIAFAASQYDPHETFHHTKALTEGQLSLDGLTVKVTATGKIISPHTN